MFGTCRISCDPLFLKRYHCYLKKFLVLVFNFIKERNLFMPTVKISKKLQSRMTKKEFEEYLIGSG